MMQGITAHKIAPAPVAPGSPANLGYSGAGGDIYEFWDAEALVKPIGGLDAWPSTSPTGLAPAQATGALQPDYSPVSFNGYRPGVTGDAATKYLRTASLGNLPLGANSCEVWVLLNQPVAGTVAGTRIAMAYGGAFNTTRRDVGRVASSNVNRARGNTATGSAEQQVLNSTVDFSGYKLVRYQVTGGTAGTCSHQVDVDGVAGTPVTGLSFNVASNGNLTLFANSNATPLQFSGITISAVAVTKPLDSTKAAALKAFFDERTAALTFTQQTFVSNRTVILGNEWAKSAHNNAWNIGRSDRAPGKHFRFEVRDGDFATTPNDGTIKNRSEMQSTVKAPFETDFWTSIWLRVRAGAPILAPWNEIFQFHGTTDSGESGSGSILALELRTDETIIVRRRYSTVNPTDDSNVTTVTDYTIPAIVRDRWYPFVGRHRFSYNGTGQLQLWWDRAEILNLSGINYGYNDLVGPYAKMGIYRPASTETLVVEAAMPEVSLSSLASRILSPLKFV